MLGDEKPKTTVIHRTEVCVDTISMFHLKKQQQLCLPMCVDMKLGCKFINLLKTMYCLFIYRHNYYNYAPYTELNTLMDTEPDKSRMK